MLPIVYVYSGCTVPDNIALEHTRHACFHSGRLRNNNFQNDGIGKTCSLTRLSDIKLAELVRLTDSLRLLPQPLPLLSLFVMFPHCDGIRKLMTSYTTNNYNKKYLKCQHSKCTEFQWLSDANVQSGSSTGTSSGSGCFGCGGSSYWIRDCPWKESKCEVQVVEGYFRGLQGSKNENLNVKVTVEMGLDEFIKEFKIKTTM
ncbi:hypothetical protein GIB67_009099 [Kingdonia uniflora]|uniref:Uncharacterized protein n=1 Tax=Kingdonia uniflora TaxID=39325 RepID=A0A7J7N3X3_9MAGN|nr:hypothetical protein GIB67_009099 [Kingdonia uniflora]